MTLFRNFLLFLFTLSLLPCQQALAQFPFVIDTAVKHQNMSGFGGSLAWYCDRITSSSKRDEIISLIVNDLGVDIVRLKNWYYPSGYPSVKAPTTMEVSWFKQHFDATNQLYSLIKAGNPNVKFLLSSWGPPSPLKSNNSLYQGTLKKNVNGEYMYGEIGRYMADMLTYITFSPDYLSIQNEPGYVNPGWETCRFMPVENDTLAGYDLLFRHSWDSIKHRTNPPKMLAPEVENISRTSWDFSLNRFREFTNSVRNEYGLFGYSYHLYNYYTRPYDIDSLRLNIIKNEFSDKPNFMTEFSSTDFNWHHTADIIHETVTKANASAYLYWELMWDQNSTSAMIRVDNTGNYTIGPHYHTIKHYSKFIDEGYTRIGAFGGDTAVKLTAYLNPSKTQITIVAMNCYESERGISLSFPGTDPSIIGIAHAWQSTEGNYFSDVSANVSLDDEIVLPSRSMLTLVVNVVIPASAHKKSNTLKDLHYSPNPFNEDLIISLPVDAEATVVFIKDGTGRTVGSYFLQPGKQHSIGNSLLPGIYYVIPENGSSIRAMKIIKQ
jgi:O-glycosyl hydrolase